MRSGWLAIGVAVVVLVALGRLLAGDDDGPRGPRSSSFATSAGGAAALASLLPRDGHRVRRLRTPVDQQRPRPGWTVVVLDPGPLRRAERRALAAFVHAGGRLVAGGTGTDAIAAALTRSPPQRARDDDATRIWRPSGRASPAGVRSVATADGRTWATAGAGRAFLAAGSRPGAVVLRAGLGQALLLADASPLQNRLLARADDAALALALAGPDSREVAFVESVHGYGRSSGLAAIPGRWGLAAAGLALAAALLGWSRGRRLGPPETAERELPPPRRAYVEALAATLARTHDRARAAAPVRAAAQEHVRRRGGLAADASPAALAEAARRLGLPEDEVQAVAGEAAPGLLATGRALAHLAGTTEGDRT